MKLRIDTSSILNLKKYFSNDGTLILRIYIGSLNYRKIQSILGIDFYDFLNFEAFVQRNSVRT